MDTQSSVEVKEASLNQPPVSVEVEEKKKLSNN